MKKSNFERAIETIERNARSQARLIDDCWTCRASSPAIFASTFARSISVTVVEAAKDGLLPTAEAKRILLQTEFEPKGCLVKGDPNRLRQVIWNLVLNAIKFTPRGGNVTVTLECADPYGRLKVIDTGEGIASGVSPLCLRSFPSS